MIKINRIRKGREETIRIRKNNIRENPRTTSHTPHMKSYHVWIHVPQRNVFDARKKPTFYTEYEHVYVPNYIPKQQLRQYIAKILKDKYGNVR